MITNRDKKILNFVEEHGSITIKQCARYFFTKNKQAYDQSRKRLQVLHKKGHLKRYRKNPKYEAVYYIDKKLKIHSLKALDVLVEFLFIKNLERVLYKKEVEFLDKKYFIDLVIKTINNDDDNSIFVEVDYTHPTEEEKIKEVIYDYEHKNSKPCLFINVKLNQLDVKIKNIGNNSKLIIFPWSLINFNEIISKEFHRLIEHNKLNK